MKQLLSLALPLLVGATSLGCSSSSSSSSGPEQIDATWSEIYPLLFPRMTKAQCTFCHGLPPNEKSNGNLSVGADKESAYQALVGKTSVSARCSGKPFVVPGKPDESLLLLKVTDPPCGDRMPLGGSPLTSDQIAMIRGWIANGAKDD